MKFNIDNLFNYDFIIAPRSIHRDILQSKQDFPYSHAKIITKEDLFSSLYFTIDEMAIYPIIKKFNLTYQSAKNFIDNLYFFSELDSSKKIQQLFDIFHFLDKEKLIYRTDESLLYLHKNAIVINYSAQDLELKKLLEKSLLHFEFYQGETKKTNTDVLSFTSVSSEVAFQINRMASLLENGVAASEILLFAPTEEYRVEIKLWAKEFSCVIGQNEAKSLLVFPRVQTLLTTLESLDDEQILIDQLSIKELSSEEQEFLLVISKYRRNNLSFKDYILLVRDQLKRRKISSDRYLSHIKVIDQLPLFVRDKHVFILGFTKGMYPYVEIDNSFIFDQEKVDLALNTTLINNQINSELLFATLTSDNTFYPSFTLEIAGQKQIVSDMVEQLGWRVSRAKLPQIYFSKTYLETIYGRMMDQRIKYNLIDKNISILAPLVGDSYQSFDHSFKGVNHFNNSSPLALSFSQIDLYYSCPFRYYLEKVLKLGNKTTTLPMFIGTLFHKLLEVSNDDDLDVDLFLKGNIAESGLDAREKLIVLGMSDLFIAGLRLKKELEEQMEEFSSLSEVELKLQLDEKTKISGRIDQIYQFKNGGLVLIDYKTGVKKFNVNEIPHGKSLQLPIYALLAAHDLRFSDDYILGLFLQKLKQDGLIISEDEEERYQFYKTSFKFSGVMLDDFDKLSKFDSTFVDQNSQYIAATKYSSNQQRFFKYTKAYPEEFFPKLAEEARAKIIEAANNIRDNNFQIRPLKIAKQDSCEYCPFKHVCYRTDADYNEVSLVDEEDVSDET